MLDVASKLADWMAMNITAAACKGASLDPPAPFAGCRGPGGIITVVAAVDQLMSAGPPSWRRDFPAPSRQR